MQSPCMLNMVAAPLAVGKVCCPEKCCSAMVSWVTAQLYEEQTFPCVIAVTQACCEPVLQSSTEQWGMLFALTSTAVHFCWLTAHLYEEQISTGITAGTQACCEPVLQSSIVQ